MLNVEMQTYTYIRSTIVQIYCTILADIVRHKNCPKPFVKSVIASKPWPVKQQQRDQRRMVTIK